MDRTKIEAGQVGQMVALGAFALCKVDADIAPIKVGDLLTTSPTKGHAQKVLDPSKAVGAILGKALGPLKKGKGKIPVMVVLQ
jgi:predicted RecA/RadA family phage recombinase